MWSLCSIQVGILVICEDLYVEKQWKVCHAFATFVARRTSAGKVSGENKGMDPKASYLHCLSIA